MEGDIKLMKIGQTRFWVDRDRGSIGIRSSNRRTDTTPLEFYLLKWFRILPDFNFYESSEDGGRELRLSFRWLWFSLNMLLCQMKPREDGNRFDDRDRKWGVHVMDGRNVWFSWGKRYATWDIPFVSTVLVSNHVLSIDRERVVWTDRRGKFMEDFKRQEEVKAANSLTLDYRYETLRGEVQNVKATVVAERRVVRRKWSPFKRNIDSIWVTFSEEVGPERGSWKGGVTGCGYTMKRGETAVQTLRRMESERRFER